MMVRYSPQLHGRYYRGRTMAPRRIRLGLGQEYAGFVGEACDMSAGPAASACVQRNQQAATAALATHAAAQNDIFRSNCEASNAANPQYTRDCDAMYPDVNVDRAVQSYVETGDWAALPGVFTTASGEATNRPPASTGTTASTAKPLSARIVNESRAAGYVVGDNWRVEVTGPAGQTVNVSAIQNGQDLGTTEMGKTDGSGNFVTRGQFTADVIGTWSETWRVGGAVAGSFNFTVAAKATAPAGNGDRQPPPANGEETADGGFDWGDVTSLPSRVPSWGWLALAVGGLVLFWPPRGGR